MEKYFKEKYICYILSLYHLPKIRNYYLFTELEEVPVSDKKQKKYRDLNLFIQEMIINYSNYRFIKLSLKNKLDFEEVDQAQLGDLKIKINNDFNKYNEFYDDSIGEAISIIFEKTGIQVYSYSMEEYIKCTDIVPNIILDYIKKSKFMEIDNYCFQIKKYELHLQYLENLIKNLKEFKYSFERNEYNFLFNSMIFSCGEHCYILRKNLLNKEKDEYELFSSSTFINEENINENLYKPLEEYKFYKINNKISILQIIFTKLN